MPDYPSSLNDSEWEVIRPLLPHSPLTMRGRPREHSRRSILNGIFYILRTGGAWRMMPNDLPHLKTCYHYLRLWAKQGHWERIHHAIRDLARLKCLEYAGLKILQPSVDLGFDIDLEYEEALRIHRVA